MVIAVTSCNKYNIMRLNNKIISDKNHKAFTDIIIEKFGHIDLPINKYNKILTAGTDLMDTLSLDNILILTSGQILLYTATFLEFGTKVLDNTHLHLPIHNDKDLFYSVSSIYEDLIYESKVADIKNFKFTIESVRCDILTSLNHCNLKELKGDLILLNGINKQVFSNTNLEFLTTIEVDNLIRRDFLTDKFYKNTYGNTTGLLDFNSKFLWASLFIGVFAVYSLNNL
jgi:hypothetical protein